MTLAVCLVEHGLVADWNAVNPGCAIEPGDRLVSVNGLCHPELVLEQLFGEPSLRIVVEKRGGFTGALVPHCKFSVELRRTALEGFGMDVSPDTMEVLNLQDDGKVALWNQCHPFRAIVIGDRIVEVNGAHTAKHDVFVSELNLELVVVRGSSIAMFGTFGVTLTVAGRLGFGVSPTMEVDKLEQAGAAQQWNVSNPINKLRLGDKLIQVNSKINRTKMLSELKGGRVLKLIVARSERRVDRNSCALFTWKECQREWPKDADQRWSAMALMSGASTQAGFAQCGLWGNDGV